MSQNTFIATIDTGDIYAELEITCIAEPWHQPTDRGCIHGVEIQDIKLAGEGLSGVREFAVPISRPNQAAVYADLTVNERDAKAVETLRDYIQRLIDDHADSVAQDIADSL
jgi:hypothetical protein